MPQALLVVDIQNDYFPGGRMPLEGSEAAADNAARLLRRFRERGFPIVHMQHVSTRPGAGFFLPDTEGVQIHETVQPRAGEAVLVKHFPNSFRDTKLMEHLGALGVDSLVIAGMMTHMCIDATTRAAFDLGLRCTLAHDACATRALAFGGTEVPAQEVHLSFVAALHGLFAQARGAREIEVAL